MNISNSITNSTIQQEGNSAPIVGARRHRVGLTCSVLQSSPYVSPRDAEALLGIFSEATRRHGGRRDWSELLQDPAAWAFLLTDQELAELMRWAKSFQQQLRRQVHTGRSGAARTHVWFVALQAE